MRIHLGALLILWICACAQPKSELERSSAGDTVLDRLSWLAGHWKHEDENWVYEEGWFNPDGDLMVGVNRTVNQEAESASFEYLRIVLQGEDLFYYASPGGREATIFKMVELEEHKVVFENPEHDFPQKIVYWLEEDERLHARIEGEVNGESRSSEWSWDRF